MNQSAPIKMKLIIAKPADTNQQIPTAPLKKFFKAQIE
jgi:hypothetical protein